MASLKSGSGKTTAEANMQLLSLQEAQDRASYNFRYGMLLGAVIGAFATVFAIVAGLYYFVGFEGWQMEVDRKVIVLPNE